MKNFRYFCCCAIATIALISCEKPLTGITDDGNVVLDFKTTSKDVTRSAVSDYFNKLNVQLFDFRGDKVFDKVKTQTVDDEGFGHMTVTLNEGTYTLVAVGHSSIKSATIKSPDMVQFTASDGEKLTDTFCYCGLIQVGEDQDYHTLTMNRVCAMLQFCLTDEQVPSVFDRLKIDYTGGSANFNPSTFLGTTKSTQSETRQRSDIGVYQCYTFPYQAVECNLKVTVSALDANDNIIRKRVFTDVPMHRNRITTYTGPFFEPGDGNFTVTDFGFNVNGDWDGEDTHTF